METRTLRIIFADPILTLEQINLDPQSSIVFDTGIKVKPTPGHELTFVEDETLFGMGIRIVVRLNYNGLSTVQIVFINTTTNKVTVLKNHPILSCKVQLFPTPWREYLSNAKAVPNADSGCELTNVQNVVHKALSKCVDKVTSFFKKIIEKFIKILDK